MKLFRYFSVSHSIANRLTWRVIGTMVIVLTLLLSLVFLIMWFLGVAFLSFVYISSMEVSSEKIFNVFTSVEVAVKNNVPEVEESINDRKRQYFAAEHLVRLNTNIIGSSVALNPDCEPFKGETSAPYVFRDNTGMIHNIRLDTKEYDYIHQEWYTKPLEEKQGVWSNPYHDTGGGEVPMVTFSLPLTNKQGNVYAIHTADISLRWIDDLRMQMERSLMEDTPLSAFNFGSGTPIYSFIVTHDGTFISHPDKQLVMTTKYQDYYKGLSFNSGENGSTGFTDSLKEHQMVFYNYIKNTGWTMCTIVPFSSILGPVTYCLLVLGGIVIIGLIIVALVCRSTIRRITQPLSQFADSADKIAQGNFQAELPQINTRDEMLRLHNSFKTMQTSLVRQIEETRHVNEEKGRMESELLIARNIQMSMLPKNFPPFPDRTDINVYACLTPAREVGGDLYDFYIRDEKLFFCIGDVSGKGVPASLVMAVTRSLFRTVSSHESLPSTIMWALNESITTDNDSNMFVTLFIGVLDLPTGHLRYCNAGHNLPVLIKPSGADWLACDTNIVLGIIKGWIFKSCETMINQDTTLFLYTDGLTEAEDSSYRQFQDERLMDVVQRSSHEPQQLIGSMTDAVHTFVAGAEQSDDLTMMAIKYNKQQQDIRFEKHLTLTNNIEEIPQLAAFVDEVCETAELDMSKTTNMNLALEEAVVNVMDYAYPAGTVGEVQIDALLGNKELCFVIRDKGKPFDPTVQNETDTTLSLDERPIGGLGIYLVRQLMDSINYERVDGQNVLTLRKKL